jgi:hypothetical protein
MLPFNLRSLQKAIMLPSDLELDRKKGHPNPAQIYLMKNPFPKVVKGKKGKKGKKK